MVREEEVVEEGAKMSSPRFFGWTRKWTSKPKMTSHHSFLLITACPSTLRSGYQLPLLRTCGLPRDRKSELLIEQRRAGTHHQACHATYFAPPLPIGMEGTLFRRLSRLGSSSEE